MPLKLSAMFSALLNPEKAAYLKEHNDVDKTPISFIFRSNCPLKENFAQYQNS